MTQNAPAPPQAEDYDAIHLAVMETSRGHWFLTEFARRNRNTDTALVLAAIKRIESAMRNQTAISGPSHADQAAHHQDPLSVVLAHQLHELRDAIALTKESLPEIAADGRIALRNTDFSRIAAGIERVAGRMRASAEQAAQSAQSLRERAHKEFGIEKDALDRRASELDAQAQDLSTFCTQLDEQIESARMVATLLAEIEAQLDGMIERQKNAPPEPRVINPAPPPPPAPEPPIAAPVPPVAAHTPPLPPAEPVAVSAPPAPQVQAAVAAPPPQPAPKAAQATEPVAVSTPPPAPEPQAAVAPPSQPAPEPVQAIEPTPETVQTVEPVAIQPEPGPAAIEPAVAAVAPPDNKWMENLAPPVHPHHTADAPANFDFAEDAKEEAKPAIALPNPAARELAESAPEPEPPKPQEPLAQAQPPRIKVMPQATVPPDDPTDFLFEPLSEAPPSRPAPATNGAAANGKPAAPPTKPADPLAPIMALSEEEKIALFS